MSAKTSYSPPLIKLYLAIPFFEELEAREINTQPILDEMHLSHKQLYSEDTFVTAIVMYQCLERCSEIANDPYLGVVVGEKLNIHAWPLFTEAVSSATTAADFFVRFIVKSQELANSIEYRLSIKGKGARFQINRVFRPPLIPSQADSFYVGLFANIFSYVFTPVWEPEKVVIRISNPDIVPPEYRKVRVSRGDLHGFHIDFPVDWLLARINNSNTNFSVVKPDSNALIPENFLEGIRRALLPYLHINNLDAEQAARLCGYSARVINRKLNKHNTTLTRELSYLRQQKASQALLKSDKSIAGIGGSVGFSDPGNFTRSFKRWTGLSPSAYRKRSAK